MNRRLPIGGVPVRRNLSVFAGLFGAFVLLALWPAEAEAQRRAGRVHVVRPAIFVSAHSYYPFGHPFYWQRYPYPYPYPYGYRVDYRSAIRIEGPKEAEVYANGYFVGNVDDFDGWSQRLYLQPGEYEITVFLEGHQPRTEMMLLRPAETYRLRAALEPLQPGEAPAERPSPSAARGASAPDGRDFYQRAPARPGAARQGDLGTLSIRVQPEGAVVFIDGERWEWPSGESQLAVEVPAGRRQVEIRREGHRTYTTTVDVRPGEVRNLNVSLPRQ